MNKVSNVNTPPSKGVHTIGWIATVLVIIGALNWLLVGLFDLNVVAAIFGRMSTLSRIIYVLVGIGGLYEIYFARVLAREAHFGMGTPTARAT